MFEAGALIFRIQSLGVAQNKRDQAEAKEAFEKTGKAAEDAGRKVDGSGDATERASKKSRDSKKPLDEQAKATEEVGRRSKKSSEEQDKQKASTEQQIEAAKKLSAVLLIAGTAVGALVGLSVAKFASFDQQMANTSAAVMATADEQRALGEAALEAGADTAYSAEEAAAAEEELAKAGQSVADIVGGSLNGALALAAAGQLQVARSAEIMATTLTQFRLPAEKAAHVSDVLAAGAGKAQGSVDDLALALSYVGPLAGSVGLSLEQTAGTIAYFSTQGIIGEKAGTSLRGVLASLQAPSAAAAGVMKQYGINMYDANGEMLSLSGIAEQLKTRLGGLTEQERLAALGRIFGNESLNAATLLYEGGAEAVEKWTAEVDDSGYAADQAAKRQDNLAGDVEKLGGAFDTALIRTGSGANDVLRDMVQMLTALVDWYGELPAPIQGTALVLGVATAAVLLFAGSAVGLRAKFMELKLAMDASNASMGRTALIGGAAGLALTGIVTIVSLLAQAQADARARAQAYVDTLDDVTGAITENTRQITANSLAAKRDWWVFGGASIADNARQIGLGIDVVTDAVYGNEDALEAVNDAVSKYAFGTEEAKAKAEELGISQTDLMLIAQDVQKAVEGETDAIATGTEVKRDEIAATDEGVESTQSAADAYLEASAGAQDLNDQLQQLIDTIMEANGIGQDAISANIDYQDALRKVDEQIAKVTAGEEGFAAGLDIATAAGARNKELLVALAEDSQKAADAQYALDGNTDQYRATLEAGRQALIDRATQLGANADEAQALADQIYRIPSETEWKVIAETRQAQWDLDQFLAANASKRIHVAVGIGGAGGITQADGGHVKFFANGGGHREDHIAQFARAGTYRVWAEPETGGEWYLPDAGSKRARSVEIAGRMLDGWGYDMVPKGASPAPTAAIDNVRITGTLDLGNGLVGFVDGRISAAGRAENARWDGGEVSL